MNRSGSEVQHFETNSNGVRPLRVFRRTCTQSEYGGGEIELEESWVNGGTEKWSDFAVFGFNKEGLALTFPQYQVACYADGPQRALIRWKVIRPHVKEYVLAALGREFELFDEKESHEQ